MSDAQTIATAFAQARRTARPLASFPGEVPTTLREAYAIQHEAIAQWPDRVAGWKVGRILGQLATELKADRFLGPIFSETVHSVAPGELAAFDAFDGGFAALEVEIVAVIGIDHDEGRGPVSTADARRAVKGFHVGIEVAGAPLARIDELGSLASIAAFGNNNGLLLGPSIADGLARSDTEWTASADIDGVRAGEGDAARLPGGIWAAVAFAMETAAHLGMPLRAGQFISTGALTGVHAVRVGQRCSADFGGDGVLECDVVAAGPREPATAS